MTLLPPTRGASLGFASSTEQLSKLCSLLNESTGMGSLVFKSIPLFMNQSASGFSFQHGTVHINAIQLLSVTDYIRVKDYMDNVVSSLDCEMSTLQHLADIGEDIQTGGDIYIITRKGQTAKLLAGNPLRGKFALSPLNFKFSSDDLEIRFAIRKASTLSLPKFGLTASLDPISGDPLSDIQISESAHVQMDVDDFMAMTDKELFPGDLCTSIHLSANSK
jgi:hypothetical protein